MTTYLTKPSVGRAPSPATTTTSAVVGLGYVGLPTALSLVRSGHAVTGVDVSDERLAAVRRGCVDLPSSQRAELVDAVGTGALVLSSDAAALRDADAVIICVPTPIDSHLVPDLGALRAACESVVAHARPGQVIVLTSTTFLGSTRQFLAEPLRDRNLVPGRHLSLAFSPERINPGGDAALARDVPRVVGGVTEACTQAATAILRDTTPHVVTVASPEAAEMVKLWENTFRAVNIALANECADIASSAGLDPIEIIDAASTKPYGFMPFYPGPGVGGHCIPCDPHYLLWQLRARQRSAPLIGQAMGQIALRPRRVAARAIEVLGASGTPVNGAKVLLVGLTYKAGVADLRESPMLKVAALLRQEGAVVEAVDPLVQGEVRDSDGNTLTVVPAHAATAHDMVILGFTDEATAAPLLDEAALVLDTTYRCPLPVAETL